MKEKSEDVHDCYADTRKTEMKSKQVHKEAQKQTGVEITVTPSRTQAQPHLWSYNGFVDSQNWQRAFSSKEGGVTNGHSPKRERVKLAVKSVTHFQGHVCPSKESLGFSLPKNPISKSLEGGDPPQQATKEGATTTTLDAKLNRKANRKTASESVCSEQTKPVGNQHNHALTRKYHSTRHLEKPRDVDRRQRRAKSVRDMRTKDRDGHHPLPGNNALKEHADGRAHRSPGTKSCGTSPSMRTSRKSFSSTRQVEIDPDGAVRSVIRQAPLSEGQERKKILVVRRKPEGEADCQMDRALSSRHLRQSSLRQARAASLTSKKVAVMKTSAIDRAFDAPLERSVPLRAPSGGECLIQAAKTKDDNSFGDSKPNSSTVGTADDLTDSEQGIEHEHKDTCHSQGGLNVDQQRSPRPRVRQRIRITNARQVSKQNARQVFISAGNRGSARRDIEDNDISDESSLSARLSDYGPAEPPAQLEIALEPLSRQSPTTSNEELANQSRVSRRLMSVTKSPFKVAGKLFKKAHATAGGEREYTLPGNLPLDDAIPGCNTEAIKMIEAIGITIDQLEMLRKAGFKITPS